MSNALRTLALSAALAVLAPMAAHAAVVQTDLVIKFDSSGGWALNTPGDIQYTSGVTISNAMVFDTGSGLALVASNADPFNNPITITFTLTNFQLNTLELDHANGADITVNVVGQSGGANTFKLPATKFVNGRFATEHGVLGCPDPANCAAGSPLLAGDELIQSISFVPNLLGGTDPDAFGLNFMNLTLSGNTGGTVPEPAGYGLAALALLAAGAASRRRKAD